LSELINAPDVSSLRSAALARTGKPDVTSMIAAATVAARLMLSP